MKVAYLLLLISLCVLTTTYSKSVDTLKVGFTEAAPFLYEENGEIEGPMVWLWEQIITENDYTYSLEALSSEELLNSIESGAVDISLFPLSITSDRTKHIDFSVPFYLASSGIMTKKLSNWDKSILFIKTVFSLNFFRALGALVLIILSFGFFAWLFERKSNDAEFSRDVKGLWSGFWWSAVTMTTVGYGDKSPKSTGGRIVALIWMFLAIMIISGFTASIASSLTVTELETSSENMESFKKRKIGTVENSATHKWLKDNFYRNKTLYPTKEALLEALKNNEIEAIAYDLPLLKEMYKKVELDHFRILEIKYNPQYYALGMNKNIPDSIRKNINTALLKATESHDWNILLTEYNLKD